MGDLHSDRSRAVVIDTNRMDWQASPAAGVWRKRLELVGETESGMVTSLVRFDPGAGFPRHDHPTGEEVLVLDGVFADEHGTYPKGTWTLLPNKSPHAPKTESGCTLFVKLCQYPGDGLPAFNKDTTDESGWHETRPGREQFDLFLDSENGEQTYLARMTPGAQSPHHVHEGGEEVFVISGDLRDENGRYGAGSWLRLPHGTSHTPWSETGCLLYVRRGHMRPAA